MLTFVAFSTFHTRFAWPPCATCVGVASKLMIRGTCPLPTVTIALLVSCEPSLAVAVSVYVVVCCGDTCVVPLCATVPTPEIDTVLAFCVVHVSVDVPPGAMFVGDAENCI